MDQYWVHSILRVQAAHEEMLHTTLEQQTLDNHYELYYYYVQYSCPVLSGPCALWSVYLTPPRNQPEELELDSKSGLSKCHGPLEQLKYHRLGNTHPLKPLFSNPVLSNRTTDWLMLPWTRLSPTGH